MPILGIRGDKSHIRILKDGQPTAWSEATNMTYGEVSQFINDHYCGRKDPEVDVLTMGYEGSINFLVKDDSVDVLMAEIKAARDAGVALPTIDIIYVEQYPGGAQTSFHFIGVELILANRTSAGSDQKITKSLNFKASKLRINRS